MPDHARRCSSSTTPVDASYGWLRHALMAYPAVFRARLRGGRACATSSPVGALGGELCAVVKRAPNGDDDVLDATAAEAELANGFIIEAIGFLGGRTPPNFGRCASGAALIHRCSASGRRRGRFDEEVDASIFDYYF